MYIIYNTDIYNIYNINNVLLSFCHYVSVKYFSCVKTLYGTNVKNPSRDLANLDVLHGPPYQLYDRFPGR